MINKTKEVLKFLVGFQTAHTLIHILVQFSNILPHQVPLLGFTMTPALNFWAIIVNGAILVALIYFAY